MATITQKHRAFAVKTALGEDVLVFWRMTASEQLGRLFEFDLELLSEKKPSIKLADVLGTNMTIRVELPYQHGTRYFNGFVTQFGYLGTRSLRYEVYRAKLSPWLWFLTRTSNCRIFQNKTVPEIIMEVFRKCGFTDFIDNTNGSYRKWEYCVQYRETDFNFVSRLMEQEGMYYYFVHEDGKHTLILADGYGSHSEFPRYEEVPYFPPDVHDHRRRDHLFEWFVFQEVQPGAYALDDYDFKAPRKDLYTVLNKPKKHAQAKFEMYDYPGEYVETGDGENYSKIRLQELLAQHEIARGRGNAAGLAAGYLFKLIECPREEHNRKYLITSAVHRLESDEYETAAGLGSAGKLYDVELTAINAEQPEQPYRAPRITSKPVVQGPQTAVVVGPKGDEIYTDQYGRVKVQFHWDREGKNDENSSCWIRVSQTWAGERWGAIHIPRIGQEVIVDFLEGDPDQPIITGRVYNGLKMPPYDLTANQTRSGVKSRSSKDGGPENFNEIRFEDKKGEEEVYLHAEKDMNVVVENNATLKIGFDKKSPGNQTIDIYNDRTTTLEQGNDELHLKMGNRSVTLDMGNHTLAIKMGNQTTKLDLGKSTTEALQSIELKVGQSSIKVDQTGVTIKGMMVKIEGTVQAELKSLMTTINGDAMLTAKGGIIMIG